MCGSTILEFDSLRLNSPNAVASAVLDIYRELRQGRRVLARICGARWSAQATSWLGHALERAGVPYAVDTPAAAEQAYTAAQPQDDVAHHLIAVDDPVRQTLPTTPAAATPIRIVLLGLGTVGLGVYRYLAARPDLFDVQRVVVRDPVKHRHDEVAAERFSTNLWQAINEPADLVIELVGGVAPIGDVVHAALLRGRAVISANKALLATRWDTFERYAGLSHPRLRFSAAVGGSLPVLESVARLKAHQGVARVRAVINGTCNFILDELANGRSFADALALAQANGFAEADPRADISGADAAQKLRLIARAAFASAPDQANFECQGIGHIDRAAIRAAETRGRHIRLVAGCSKEDGTIRARVRPEELDANDFLAGARHEENRVEITTVSGETWRLAGKGAGRWPTALAVLGDVNDFLAARVARARATQSRSAHV